MDLEVLRPNDQGWVNARLLHKLLGVKTHYADWVKRRLLDNLAQYGSDYVTFQEIEKRATSPRGGASVRNEYLISMFMAEHFAMMERTPSSKRIRELYIRCRIEHEALRADNYRLRSENEMLKAPKPRRLTSGDVIETYTNITETRDMFGLISQEKHVVKKYRSQMTEAERREAKMQHLARVQEGLSRSMKETACGDNVVPIRGTK